MEPHQILIKKRELFLRNNIEEKCFIKMAINMLCLAYAYSVKSEIAELFICSGCEENQGNQLGHDCCMLSSDDILTLYFDEALKRANHLDTVQMWQEFTVCSSIPPVILQDVMQNQHLRSEEYVKTNYANAIKTFVKKIDKADTNLFL